MIQPIRVLLVEDNPGDVELTRETLESSRLKLAVDVAIDGEQALESLMRRPPFQDRPLPDLVLLDLNLPRMDGREVLAAMRAQAHLRAIPVVILTTSDAEHDIARSYSSGANCYITKPVGLDAFQEVVRSVENFWFTVVKLP